MDQRSLLPDSVAESHAVDLDPTANNPPLDPSPGDGSPPIEAPPSESYGPARLVTEEELALRVMRQIVGHSGRFGIAIKELSSGRGAIIDPEGKYRAASLYKLAVMYEVFRQRELGTLSLDDRVAGSSMTVRQALERMVTVSDNSAASLLVGRVDVRNINREMRELGLHRTQISLTDVATSPADMLAFLEKLAVGEGVSHAASEEMVEILSRQRINDRIPRLLPTDTVVAHKTGDLPGVVNDAGIVFGPEATVIVVVLVNQTKNGRAAARVAAEVAATAYDYFHAAVLPPVS